MKKRNKKKEIYDFVSEKVGHYPDSMSKLLQDSFNLTRQGAYYHLNNMIKENLLIAKREGTRKRYFIVPHKEWTNCYEIDSQPDEYSVWEDVQKNLTQDIPENVAFTLSYGFTEMFNNAKDHSEGTVICVAVKTYRTKIKVTIFDDGIGIFKKIKLAENLDNEQQSILVLSKGKFTTDPQNHSGEGIFFTSRAFDFFDIISNELCFIHEREGCNDWLLDQEIYESGTVVVMELSLNSEIKMEELFSKFTTDLDHPEFNQTIVPVKKLSKGQIVSRSQGKRLMTGLEKFDAVRLDFDGVKQIGQGFADEVFRVWVRNHPQIDLHCTNTNKLIKDMVNRSRSK